MGFFKSLWIELFERGDLPEGPEFDGPEHQDNAPQALKDAECRCPTNTFVQGCRNFYDKRGFLSQKQLNALTNAEVPRKRKRYSYNHFD